MRPWELLLRNANVLQSVLEKAEPELSLLELDARRLFILCTVEANAFPADLARVLSMPKPSMTFLIKKLEESGYLRRQGEKGDLRRYRLTITPAGIKARDKGAEAVNRIFGDCLNSLSAADQATLSRILDQLQPRGPRPVGRRTTGPVRGYRSPARGAVGQHPQGTKGR
jgi:DNA-binding MarR family transcriptional regulator